jgi:hypothetical protein
VKLFVKHPDWILIHFKLFFLVFDLKLSEEEVSINSVHMRVNHMPFVRFQPCDFHAKRRAMLSTKSVLDMPGAQWHLS